MSKTKDKASIEFDILEKTVKDAIILPFKDEILALVDKFGNSGQSGGSAPYISQAISQAVKSLCMQEPLCDITGHDSEWVDISEYRSKKKWQNNRESGVFKEVDGTCNYNDGIVFRGDITGTFTGSGSVTLKDGTKIGSIQKIKSFPFKPKTFIIDVIETEWADKDEKVKKAGGGWWTSIVKDEEQLKEVMEYYDGLQPIEERKKINSTCSNVDNLPTGQSDCCKE